MVKNIPSNWSVTDQFEKPRNPALDLLNEHRAQWDLPALEAWTRTDISLIDELSRISEIAQYGNCPFDTKEIETAIQNAHDVAASLDEEV